MTADLEELARAADDPHGFALVLASVTDADARALLARSRAAVARGGVRAAGQILHAFGGERLAGAAETELVRRCAGRPVALRLARHDCLVPRPWSFSIDAPDRVESMLVDHSAVFVCDQDRVLSRFGEGGVLTARRALASAAYPPLALGPNGNLHVGMSDGAILEVDEATLEPRGITERVGAHCVAVASRGGVLVAAYPHALRAHELPTERVHLARVDESRVTRLAVGPPGTVVALTDLGELRLYSLPALRLLARASTGLRGASIAVDSRGVALVVGKSSRSGSRFLLAPGAIVPLGVMPFGFEAKMVWAANRANLAFVSGEGRLFLFDIERGEPVARVPEPTGSPGAMSPWFAVGPGGRRCATASGTTVRVWDVANLPPPNGTTGGRAPLRLRATPRLAACYHSDQRIRRWAVSSGVEMSEVDLRAKAVRDYCLDFAPDVETAAYARNEGGLVVRSLDDVEAETLGMTAPEITCIVAMRGRRSMIVGDASGSVSVWSFSGRWEEDIGRLRSRVVHAALSPDERSIVVAADDGQLAVWSTAPGAGWRAVAGFPAWAPTCVTDSGIVVRAAPDEIELVSATKKRAISRSAHAVCALDGDVVAAAFDDEVVLFDAVEGRPIHLSIAGGARRLGRASTPSVLLVSDEGRAAAFDWRSGEEVFVWDGPERPETFDVPSRERVVLADSLGEVCVFALARG